MGAQLLQRIRSSPLLASLLLAALLVIALLAAPLTVRAFTIAIAITGATTEFEPHEPIPFQVSVTVGENESIPSTLDLTVTGPRSFEFADIDLSPARTIDPMTDSGAVLRATIAHTDITVGYGVGGTRVTVTGTVQLPVGAPSGTYSIKAESAPEVGTATFRVMTIEEAEPTPTPAAPGPSSPVIRITLPSSVTLLTSAEGGPNLNKLFSDALGANVRILGGNAPFVLTENGQLALQIAALDLGSGMTFSGPLSFTSGGLTLNTTNGQGNATVELSDQVTVTGNVELVPRPGRVEVVFTNARLTVSVPPPDVDRLAGGNQQVTSMSVTFTLALLHLPQGASLDVQYARDPSELLPNAAAYFSQAAQSIGGTFSMNDLAYVVQVTPRGISNNDVGDNVVRLRVNGSWVQGQEGNGNTIFIAKVDTGSNVFIEEADCTGAGAVVCEATFAGDAGGFSTFGLFGVAPDVQPEPTPTPTPAPTQEPTPTPQPTPVPPDPTPTPVVEPPDPDGPLFIIILVVVLVLAAGAAGYFFYRRRQGPTPAP